jgi:hypothetical protein
VILWNEKNKAYMRIKDDFPVLNLRYEDLLVEPEKVIEKIIDFCGCGKQKSYFTNVRESTKEDSKNYSYYRDYYLKEKWREKLSEQSIKIINKHLDPEVLKFYNYSLIT